MDKINKCTYTCELQRYRNKERSVLPEPPSPGLVLVCNWGWVQGEVHDFYKYFCDVILEKFSSFVYVYPPHASHITVATLSSFKETNAPRGLIKQGRNILSNNMSEDDKRFVATWEHEIKSKVLEEVKIFEVECIDVWFTSNALIFIFKDESGTIEKIRKKLKESVLQSEKLKALNEKFHGAVSEYLHCPNIIHSSFSRYTKDIDDKEEIERFIDQFNNVIMKQFKPFKLKINTISLCNEYVPYMHMDRAKGCIFDHPLST